jgi:peptide/nickel transport system substrate-binding protein
MVDWRNQLGTGPFMPKDIVEGSYWLFEKNPDYWQHDKLHPENRLPYVDQANMLSVPDESTRMALVRSGQMDFWTLGTETGGQVKWNFVEDLKKTNPQLQMRVGLGAPGIFAMHCKKKPYTDVRVRKAMNMAIDYPGIIKNYYQGNATQSYEMWPFLPSWGEWAIPESEFPDSVREQFTYNPEKAKQLLAEAGYPNGFKSNLDTYVPWLELSAVAVEYWRKIGIDCTITQRDLSVHWSILGPHSYPAIAVHTTSCGCLSRDPIENLEQWYKPGPGNLSEWEDQKYVDMLNAAAKIKDPYEQIKAYKKAAIYALEQAPYIMLPAQHYTSVWQPWLKGFWGQYGRYFSDMAGPGTHCWLDLDLKEQMTGKR